MLPALKTGDCIGVMAPSSYVERADIERAQALIEGHGYKSFIHPQTYERNHQSAGTGAQKAEAFHELWARNDIHAVWAAGGGNRCLPLLELINFDQLKVTPKPFVGFSDATALLNGIYAHTGIPTIHGPVLSKLHKHKQIASLIRMLEGKDTSIPLDQAQVINAGRAEGVMVGGNLSLFQYLPQTLPTPFWKNAILFLEDCNEELSRIDRMLYHLKRLDVFKDISGLVFGQFTSPKESGRPFGFSLEDIIKEHAEGLSIPIVMNAPFGHGEDLYPIQIGTRMTFDTHKGFLKLNKI